VNLKIVNTIGYGWAKAHVYYITWQEMNFAHEIKNKGEKEKWLY